MCIILQVDTKYKEDNSTLRKAMNKLTNYLLPGIIQFTKIDVQEITKKIVFEKSKFLLSGVTLKQLIDMINGFVNV